MSVLNLSNQQLAFLTVFWKSGLASLTPSMPFLSAGHKLVNCSLISRDVTLYNTLGAKLTPQVPFPICWLALGATVGFSCGAYAASDYIITTLDRMDGLCESSSSSSPPSPITANSQPQRRYQPQDEK
jgi:hypothetical protein